MKIVILESKAVNPGDLTWDPIRQFGDVTVYDRTPAEEAASRIGDANIVLINKTPITAEVLDACPNLKLICVEATGYNVVDCDAARERGVTVCNVPAYSTNCVAQFTFALLLEICNQVGLHDISVHDGDWCRSPDFCYWKTPQMELAGKTIGIIGFGMIGRAVAKIANAFNMKVLAYNRSRCAEGKALGEYVDLDTLLSQSDIISLHCPMSEQTKEMINTTTIAKMKDGVILLNTARGGLVNEADLLAALQAGKLRGFAADVVSAEPIKEGNPLLSAPNCILTPHMAWAPVEARQRIIDITVKNIQGFLDGKPINVVNPKEG
ncbi:MAG: D-2-hydroxyacid dehydrogenase [Oscillospiraceae bacterium]|nr:D-2-hydroxyacid dehydrogenase [Oscillospiraceae bacterium]